MTGLSSGTVTGPNESAKHPTKDLDDLVHQRGRLGILTVLAAKNRADFSYLQTALDMTRGNLGRHLEALADASLIHVEKGFVNRRARTWISITTPGRRALAIEMSALRALLHQYERPVADENIE